MDWFSGFHNPAAWWLATFGPWKWENFWAFAGVVANVGLGWVAVRALDASRAQARAAELQTKQMIEADRAEKERDRKLLLPSIYVSLKRLGDDFIFIIVNGSQYPIVIENIRFNGNLTDFPSDSPIESFIYEENKILSSDAKSLRRVIQPGEALEVASGNYWEWIMATNYYFLISHQVEPLFDAEGEPEFYNQVGQRFPTDRIHPDPYTFTLCIPFAYISPAAQTFELMVNFRGLRDYSLLQLIGSHIIQWDTNEIFAEVWGGIPHHDGTHLPPKP